jgi:tRNA-dihydrouridine synthase C
VAAAVRQLPMPVIANGNVVDVPTGQAWLRRSAAAGLMIGRGAIRNPWIFAQLRAAWEGGRGPQPRGRDVLEYIRELWDETAACERHYHATKQVARMKKYLCYISQGMDADGSFEYRIRRAADEAEFFSVCDEYLDHGNPVPAAPPGNSVLFSGFADLLS